MERLDDKFDIVSMVAKPLYFGMLVNVMLPAGLLFVLYATEGKFYLENQIPDFANQTFIIFAALAVIHAGLSLWWRFKIMAKPMVRRDETFEEDLLREINARSRKVFIVIALISVWGFIYYFLTARFMETALFVIFAFIVFQLVRPRYGGVRKIISFQQKLMQAGHYLRVFND